MPTRQEVYTIIDGELEYAANIWKVRAAEAGQPYIQDDRKPVEDWLMFIKGYYDDAVRAAAHEAGPWPTLHVVRKLAALSVRCMMANGIVYRDGNSVAGPTSIGMVQRAIDQERDYQDRLGPDRTDSRNHGVTGYLTMFATYLNRAIDGWTNNPGDREALDNIRKLAGIAVHCMEDHGAPARELV